MYPYYFALNKVNKIERIMRIDYKDVYKIPYTGHHVTTPVPPPPPPRGTLTFEGLIRSVKLNLVYRVRSGLKYLLTFYIHEGGGDSLPSPKADGGKSRA